jgi:hypothetical protein
LWRLGVAVKALLMMLVLVDDETHALQFGSWIAHGDRRHVTAENGAATPDDRARCAAAKTDKCIHSFWFINALRAN